jgi:putative thioredoxin
MADYVIEVSSEDFGQEVEKASHTTPVVVDFWAPWCGPCRILGPILERLAAEYGGKFRLAKINSDENLELSAKYGVRSIPNVKAFVDGKVVAEFIGALPEAAVRKFIDKLIPSPSEQLQLEAQRLAAKGDRKAAVGRLRAALRTEPGNDGLRIDLAELLIEEGKADEAEELANAVRPHIDHEERLERLRVRIAFARASAEGPDVPELQRQIEADPDNLAARIRLAGIHAARRDYEPALAQLLEIIRRDRSYDNGAARKQMVSIFELAKDQPELVSHYRRELSSALY